MAKSENSDGSQSSQANTDAFEAAIEISALRDSMSRAETDVRPEVGIVEYQRQWLGKRVGGRKWKGRVGFYYRARNSPEPY